MMFETFEDLLKDVMRSRAAGAGVDPAFAAAFAETLGVAALWVVVRQLGLRAILPLFGPVGLVAAGALTAVQAYRAVSAKAQRKDIDIQTQRLEAAERKFREIKAIVRTDPERAGRMMKRLRDDLVAGDEIQAA